uniref:Ig-like domain-containing protein n=1 Tax=Pygocentrus nattereri TaxID=42514 RepID=A0AAR2JZ69_PYGNA
VNVQPAGHVFIRERVTLTCGIESGDDWNYEWYKNNNLLRDAQRKKYEISNVDQTHAGDYTCKGTQSTGRIYTHTSAAVTLTVSGKPRLRVDPQSSVYTGDTVTLSCEPQYQSTDWIFYWKKDSQYINNHQSTFSITESHPGEAEFSCIALRGGYQTEDSDPVRITVRAGKPRLRVDPQSSVYTGDTVTLSCETPYPSTDWIFFWKKDSQYIDHHHHHQSTFSITESHPGEAEFSCIGQRLNEQSEESDPVRITVRERPKATVNVQPAGHVFIRERVTLTCGIESGDDWNYEWYKNNNLLRDAQRKKYEISNVDQTHAGDYTCKGTQSTGRIYTHTSAAVTLTVSAVKVKPTITSNPEGAALTGNTVTLYCKLHQSAGWTFYWSKHTQSSENETITNVYTISSVSLSDGGQYWCRAGRGNPVYYTHYSDALWVNVTGVSSLGAPVSALSLLSRLMAVSPYLLVSIVLGVKCYRARAGPDEENRT